MQIGVGIGVAGVVILGNDVIVGERINPNVITFPGGDVDVNDASVGAAAVRETFEECGVLTEPVGTLLDTFNIVNKDKKYVTLYILLRYISGEPQAKEPDKYRRWWWEPLDAVPYSIWIPKRELLKRIEVNRIY